MPSGLTVFFTGLSASGQSTTAELLRQKLVFLSDREVTILDGEEIRRRLSPELGFSRRDREIHIRRVADVASDIVCCRGVAICALIAPYEGIREECRAMVEAVGRFVLVYLSTPLEICERRDQKGLYAQARAGLIANFTGISGPYEPPSDSELILDTIGIGAEDAALKILQYLRDRKLER